MNSILQEVSQLFAPKELPLANEMDRMYLYFVDNKLRRLTIGCFLGRSSYRTYYLKIVNLDGTFIETSITYESLAFWRITISTINDGLKRMQMARLV